MTEALECLKSPRPTVDIAQAEHGAADLEDGDLASDVDDEAKLNEPSSSRHATSSSSDSDGEVARSFGLFV